MHNFIRIYNKCVHNNFFGFYSHQILCGMRYCNFTGRQIVVEKGMKRVGVVEKRKSQKKLFTCIITHMHEWRVCTRACVQTYVSVCLYTEKCVFNFQIDLSLRLSINMEHTCVSWGYDSNFMAHDRTNVNLTNNTQIKL